MKEQDRKVETIDVGEMSRQEAQDTLDEKTGKKTSCGVWLFVLEILAILLAALT